MKKQVRWVPRDAAYSQIFGWLAELSSLQLEIDCVLYNCIMDVAISYNDVDKAVEV